MTVPGDRRMLIAAVPDAAGRRGRRPVGGPRPPAAPGAALRADLGGVRARRLVGPARRGPATDRARDVGRCDSWWSWPPCFSCPGCSPANTSPTTPTATSGTAGSSSPGSRPTGTHPLDDHLARLRDPLLFPGLAPDQKSGVETLKKLPTDKHQLQRAGHPGHAVADEPRPGDHHLPAGRRGLVHGGRARHPVVAGGRTACRSDPRCWPSASPISSADGSRVVARTPGGPALGLVPDRRHRGQHRCARRRPRGRAARWRGHRPDRQCSAGRRLLGGFLLGLSIGAKLTPVLLLPAFTFAAETRRAAPGRPGGRSLRWRRPSRRTCRTSSPPARWSSASCPGYLNEEGFDNGQGRYAVLGLLLPPAARNRSRSCSGVVHWWSWPCGGRTPTGRRTRAVWLFGGALLIGTPGYPWYCLPLVVLAVLAGRVEWFAVAIAAYADLLRSTGCPTCPDSPSVSPASWCSSPRGRGAPRSVSGIRLTDGTGPERPFPSRSARGPGAH